MSQEDSSSIVCRQCGEVIPLDAGHCPHCGQSIRGLLWPSIGIVLGLAVVVATLVNPSDLLIFGLLGTVVAATSGYLIYDRRQRIQRAAERGGHTSSGTTDAEGEDLYS